MTAADSRRNWWTAGVVFLTGVTLVLIIRGMFWLNSSLPDDSPQKTVEVALAPPPASSVQDSGVVPAVGIIPTQPTVEIVSPTAYVTTPPVIEVLPPPKAESTPESSRPAADKGVKPVSPPPLLEVPPISVQPVTTPTLPAPKSIESTSSAAPKPTPELPAIEAPQLDLPRTLTVPTTSGPDAAKSTEQPREKPKLDYSLPSVEAPKVNLPSPVPVPELPKIDGSRKDTSKNELPRPKLNYALPEVEAPKIDLPAAASKNAPKPQEIASPVPSLDVPKFDAPRLDLPGPDIQPPKLNLPLPESTRTSQPARSAESAPALSAPPAEIRLQPLEPGNNVKNRENLPATGIPGSSSVLPLPSAALTVSTPQPAASQSPPAPTAKTMPLGDAAMTPAMRSVALSAVLGSALLAGPVSAQSDPAESGKSPPANTLVTKDDIDNLRKDMLALKVLLEGKTDKGISSDGLLQKVERLEENLRSFERRLLELERTTSSRVAASSPAGSTSITPTPSTVGTVTVVNMYPTEISIVINDRSHRVEPNEKKSIVVPSGTFKYLLLGGTGSEVVRDIKPSETITLWVK